VNQKLKIVLDVEAAVWQTLPVSTRLPRRFTNAAAKLQSNGATVGADCSDDVRVRRSVSGGDSLRACTDAVAGGAHGVEIGLRDDGSLRVACGVPDAVVCQIIRVQPLWSDTAMGVRGILPTASDMRMRKGIIGLGAKAQQHLMQDPSGAVFAFRRWSGRPDQASVLG
jgi:hypothetical protein